MKGECLNCGKKIADNISFCGYECKQEYKGKQEKTEFFKMELNFCLLYTSPSPRDRS